MQIRHKIAVLGMVMGIAISGIGAELPDGVTHFGDIDINALIQTNAAREIQNVYTYVTTNATIVSTKENLGPTLGAASGGVAFDYYETNSVYFIDGLVPTLKFFAPYRRQAYWPNQITAVEIGDETQVLRTHFMQIDGNLSVTYPSNIRFMGTLDRNAPYDQGRAMSLQDYLDAFNPVLVPETLKLFQTNRSDYSVGKMVAHDGLEVNGDGKNLFRVSANEANFMDVLTVDPDGDSHLYQVSGKYLTDVNGIITNTYAEGGYATPDPLTKVNGNLYVDKSLAVSSNVTVWGQLLVSSWDNLKVGWEGAKGAINKGAEGGYIESLDTYVKRLVQPLVDATNTYYEADAFIDVTSIKVTDPDTGRPLPGWNSWHDGERSYTANKINHEFWRVITGDKHNYNVRLWDTKYSATTSSVATLMFRLGYIDQEFSEIKFIFDATGVPNTQKWFIDIGTFNFKGMFNDDDDTIIPEGTVETVYSSVEPIERTESILRQEVYTYDNWVWDDELGDYIIDPDEPTITETYEWYDEVTYDMIWSIEPGTCWEYKFQRIGETGMKVDINRIYKTQPYTGE